jgi:hypothetical protein
MIMMAVAGVEIDWDSDIKLMAFSSNGTDNPNAFLILNKDETALEDATVSGGKLVYTAPAGSLTTFFANK